MTLYDEKNQNIFPRLASFSWSSEDRRILPYYPLCAGNTLLHLSCSFFPPGKEDMAITCWDRFTAIDWTTPATWVARLTLVVLVICAVITWFTYEDYEDKVGLWRFCCSHIMCTYLFSSFHSLLVSMFHFPSTVSLLPAQYNNNKDALIGVSVYCVFIALIMVILETPLFHCFGGISRAKEHWALSPFAKGMYYWLAAILTFIYISPNIAGMFFYLSLRIKLS